MLGNLFVLLNLVVAVSSIYLHKPIVAIGLLFIYSLLLLKNFTKTSVIFMFISWLALEISSLWWLPAALLITLIVIFYLLKTENYDVVVFKNPEALWKSILFHIVYTNDGKLKWKTPVNLVSFSVEEFEELGEGIIYFLPQGLEFKNADVNEFIRFKNLEFEKDRINLLGNIKNWHLIAEDANLILLYQVLSFFNTQYWRDLLAAFEFERGGEAEFITDDVRIIISELKLIRGQFEDAINMLSGVDESKLNRLIKTGGIIGTNLFKGALAVVLNQRGEKYKEFYEQLFKEFKAAKAIHGKLKQNFLKWIMENYDFVI